MARSASAAKAGATTVNNKGSKIEELPSRHAMTQTLGEVDTINRMRGVYKKGVKNPLDDMTPIAALITKVGA